MNIYESIATRTNGNIYIGVVGPVRTGKSTFIARFMEEMVIPKMEPGMKLNRTLDEIPQSGSGKQIMTMEPRFVPSDPVEVIFNKTRANIRLVDCVGYLIDEARGVLDENGVPRMVKTPWSEEAMPFSTASEIGTQKVINDHSTVGVMITTDGSITEIDRASYLSAEERTVNELKSLGKPFVIILNSLTPTAENTLKLKIAMEEKYKATVLVKDVRNMNENDFSEIFEKLLYEFPIKKVCFNLPEWMQTLTIDNNLIGEIMNEIRSTSVSKMSDVKVYESLFGGVEGIETPVVKEIELGVGKVCVDIPVSNKLFYSTLSSMTDIQIKNDGDLMEYIAQASVAKSQFDKLSLALSKASETGYGVVVPSINEMDLLTPEVVKKNGVNGLKLKAKAPSLHIMRVDVETEVSPAMGGVFADKIKENEDLEIADQDIWNTSMFGKSLSEIAHDGIVSKLNNFPQEAEIKVRKTLTKITNEGKGGIICILL